MGLSSAQARLLTITSRKADCEFQSMSLSHEKISISRELQSISDMYNNSLNKTKIQVNLFNNQADPIGLNYGVLMTPSVYNSYYPKLLTDASNKVVLNNEYARAAEAAGIPREGLNGTSSSMARDAFIQQLVADGVINAHSAAQIMAADYNQEVGLGWNSTPDVNTKTKEVTYNDLLKNIKNMTETGVTEMPANSHLIDSSDGSDFWQAFSRKCDDLGYENGESDYLIHPFLITSTGTNNNDWTPVNAYAQEGKTYNRSSDYLYTNKLELNLADLLDESKNYVIGYTSDHDSAGLDALRRLQIALFGQNEPKGSIMNWMADQFESLLAIDPKSEMACQTALQKVSQFLLGDQGKFISSETGHDMWNQEHDNLCKKDCSDWGEGFYNMTGLMGDYRNSYRNDNGDTRQLNVHVHTEYHGTDKDGYIDDDGCDRTAGWINKLNSENYDQYLGYYYGQNVFEYDKDTKYDKKHDAGCGVASINLSSIAEMYLAAFNDALADLDAVESSEEPKSKSSDFRFVKSANENIKNIKEAKYTLKDETEIEDTEQQLEATFYDAIFNMICNNGWTENEQVGDPEYLQQLLKNGMVFISNLSSDGYFYQNLYSTDKTFAEVTDTNAIAQAEAKYNTEKARIQSKEDAIDMKMKNLDTEIQSLNTEYDTVKSLLKDNISKSLQRYS